MKDALKERPSPPVTVGVLVIAAYLLLDWWNSHESSLAYHGTSSHPDGSLPDSHNTSLIPDNYTEKDFHVTGPQTCSEGEFVAVLHDHNPAIPTNVAQEMYQVYVKNGINSGYALAQFKWESSYGTAGIAAHTENIANMKSHSGDDLPSYDGFQDYSKFGSEGWVKSAQAQCDMLNFWVQKEGTDQVSVIQAILAPPSDGNNTNLMITHIEETMKLINQQSLAYDPKGSIAALIA